MNILYFIDSGGASCFKLDADDQNKVLSANYPIDFI